ncbi:MAG: restriction endonuclease [Anaerolineae bacterium]|nr:restriction endonuclease [Anaerolineae bacterium]MDQ7035534.1 restriction endonuclease [Anaerolineae bacterium]
MTKRRKRRKQKDTLQNAIALIWLVAVLYVAILLDKNYEMQLFGLGGIISCISVSLPMLIVLGVIQEIRGGPGSASYTRRMKSLKLANVDEMSGRDFETYVALLLKHRGYKVKVTTGSGDLGVDVIAEKGEEKLAIQCKRYSNKVPRNAVSDVVAGMNHYKCNRTMVVTTNYYQPGAHKLAKSNNVQLVDRDILSQWIQDFQDAEQNKKTN